MKKRVCVFVSVCFLVVVLAVSVANAQQEDGRESPPQIPGGDANADGILSLTDPITVLNYLFQGGQQPACARAADTNGDGVLNIGDAIGVLNYLFQGGPAPAQGEMDATNCDTEWAPISLDSPQIQERARELPDGDVLDGQIVCLNREYTNEENVVGASPIQVAGDDGECEVMAVFLTFTYEEDPPQRVLDYTRARGVFAACVSDGEEDHLAFKSVVICAGYARDTPHSRGFYGRSRDDLVLVPSPELSPIDKNALRTGSGNDKIECSAQKKCDVSASEGADIIKGSELDDSLNGGYGRDIILGKGGNDEIGSLDYGNDEEDDVFLGMGGRDRIGGGSGNDLIYGGTEDDKLMGDQISRFVGDTEIDLIVPVPPLAFSLTSDTLFGGPGDDELWGGPGSDILYGENGADEVYGFSPDLKVSFDERDNDRRFDDNDFLGRYILAITFDGQDLLLGDSRAPVSEEKIIRMVEAGESAARILAYVKEKLDASSEFVSIFKKHEEPEEPSNGGDDILVGGYNNDVLFGQNGVDRINGDTEDNFIGFGNDWIFGGTGSDDFSERIGLNGGNGNDRIHGGDGIDSLYAGNDQSLTPPGEDPNPSDISNNLLCGGNGDGGSDGKWESLLGGDGSDELRAGPNFGNPKILDGGEAGAYNNLYFNIEPVADLATNGAMIPVSAWYDLNTFPWRTFFWDIDVTDEKGFYVNFKDCASEDDSRGIAFSEPPDTGETGSCSGSGGICCRRIDITPSEHQCLFGREGVMTPQEVCDLQANFGTPGTWSPVEPDENGWTPCDAPQGGGIA